MPGTANVDYLIQLPPETDGQVMVGLLLRFNLVKVEIRELRPEVVAESDEVLVHYRSRTNVRQGLSTKTLA